MDEATGTYQGIVVPEPALLHVERRNQYGSIPDLDDEELADPEELERQAIREQWGPVLALPSKARQSSIWPAVDESGGVDWGAFGTVDFDRIVPDFDKARYKADKLREQLKDILITFSIVKERLPGKAKNLVLKYLRMGIIELEHIASEDMLCLARLYLRARAIQKEIAELEEFSRQRQKARTEAWLEALD